MGSICYQTRDCSYRLICDGNKVKYVQYESNNCVDKLSTILYIDYDCDQFIRYKGLPDMKCDYNNKSLHKKSLHRNLLSVMKIEDEFMSNLSSTTIETSSPSTKMTDNIVGYIIIGILCLIILLFWIACCFIKCLGRQQKRKREEMKNREYLNSHLLSDDQQNEDEDVLNSLPLSKSIKYKKMTLESLTHVSEEQSMISSQLKWKNTYNPSKTQSWIKFINSD